MKTTVLAVALTGVAAASAAATICVDPSGAGGCRTTIQAAVDAAAPGDLVLVHPGTYFEGVRVPEGKEGLQIAGTQRDRVVVDSSPFADRGFPGAESAFRVVAADVHIRELTVRNGSVGFWIDGSRAVISRVRAHGMDGTAAGSTVFAADVQILDSEIHDVFSGVSVAGPRTLVRDNRFRRVTYGVTVDIFSADGLQVIGNRMEGGGDPLLLGTDEVVVRSNVISGFGGFGIQVTGNNPVVEDNLVVDSGFGIEAACIDEDLPGGNEPPDCANARVARNRVLGSTARGLGIRAKAVGMVVSDNVLERTGGGIVGGISSLTEVSVLYENNRVTRAGNDLDDDCFDVFVGVVTGNRASLCSRAGFHTRFVDVRDNVALDNAENGFTIGGDPGAVAHEVTGNVSRNNAAQGIAIVPPAFQVRVEGNTALGNRTDFCDEGTGTIVGANTFGTVGPCAVFH